MSPSALGTNRSFSDRLLLMGAASLLVVGGVFLIAWLREWARISAGWTLFILGNLLYGLTTGYVASTTAWYRRGRYHMMRWMILIGLAALIILGSFLAFRSNWIPLPQKAGFYLLYTLLLTPVTIVLSQRLSKLKGPRPHAGE